MRAIKLLTDGRAMVVELPKREHLYQSMQAEIGCDMVEIVGCGLNELGEKYCMVCDEEFLLKGRPVINPVASYFYGLQKHGQPLCGDVLIMKNQFTNDGIDTVGLDNDDIAQINMIFVATFKEALIATKNFLESLKK